jgi:ribosome biogenesis GTPase
MTLEDLGWSRPFAEAFAPYAEQGLVAGRVIEEHRGLYTVALDGGTLQARARGRMAYEAETSSELPAVGDWVALRQVQESDHGVIHATLPRTSSFARKVPGEATLEQVVAANIDQVFLVSALDGDYNPRRIERYLTASWSSGASPIVVLNKIDVSEDLDAVLDEIATIAIAVPIVCMSARDGRGVDELRAHLSPRKTCALLGSSGVGKSTIINVLLGRGAQQTAPVRESDHRGRHTTTHRQLFVLEGGALLVDTPGMRELQLWSGEDAVEMTFADIDALAQACAFRDCTHSVEPNCAVQRAEQEGRLDSARLESYHKLRRELVHLAARTDERTRAKEKQRVKEATRAYNRYARSKKPR